VNEPLTRSTAGDGALANGSSGSLSPSIQLKKSPQVSEKLLWKPGIFFFLLRRMRETGTEMNLLTLFEVFLLALSFYSIANFSGVSKYAVPLACLFCILWVQKLEKKTREEEEARRRLLQYRLEKYHKSAEKTGRRVHTANDGED
jgi:hypothetical protein